MTIKLKDCTITNGTTKTIKVIPNQNHGVAFEIEAGKSTADASPVTTQFDTIQYGGDVLDADGDTVEGENQACEFFVSAAENIVNFSIPGQNNTPFSD